MNLQLLVKMLSWTKLVKYVSECSGSGLDELTSHQTS